MDAMALAFRLDLLKLIFWGTAIANLADNAASAPLTNLQLALHTDDPGSGGDQTTHEIVYTGYARAAVARSSAGWTIAGNIDDAFATLATDIAFPTATGMAGHLATYASLGFAAIGAGRIVCRGALQGPLTIVVGNAPKLVRGTAFTLG